MGTNIEPGGEIIGTPSLDVYARGLEYLGGTELRAVATTTGAVTFSPRDMLMVVVRVTSLSAVGAVALRFNGDSGANYWWKNLICIQGQSTFSYQSLVSAKQVNLAAVVATGVEGNGLSTLNVDDGGTGARVILATVFNAQTASKSLGWFCSRATGAVASVGAIFAGSGEWVNTSSQIFSVELLSANGTATMGIDSGLGVFGKNLL